MDENPNYNPFDEDNQNTRAGNDNAPIFMGDDPNFRPIDPGNESTRTLRWIIILAGALGCCVLLFAFAFFRLSSGPLIAQYFPSLTPTQNLTATAGVFQATALSAEKEWHITVSDTFDNNNGNKWYVGADDDQWAKIKYEVKDGKYRWNATAHKGFVSWVRLSDEPFTSFYVSADAQKTGNPAPGDYGIIFREDAFNNYYYFAITSNGGFFVSLYNKEKWNNIIDWTASGLIQSGKPNRLTVIGEGSRFIFFINGEYVGEMTDDHLAKGMVGLAIGLYDADAQSIFEFDNIELRAPAPPATLTPTITPTSTITPTPTITLTPHALIPAPEDAKVFNEQFDSNKKNWVSFYSDNTTVIKEGKLYLRSDKAGYVALVLCYRCSILDKAFYFQAEVIPAEKTSIKHGIAFCATGPTEEYYVFLVDSISGTYSLYKRTPQGWQTPFDAVYSQSISKYPISNTLAVQFDREKMNLYINGNLVNTYIDPDPISCGTIGIYIGDGLVDVIADNIFAYEIKETPVPTLTPTP